MTATRKSTPKKSPTKKATTDKRPVTAAEIALASPPKPAKQVEATLGKVPAIPKDAPTPEEHRRFSFAAVEENAAKISRIDETSFAPHVGKTFTFTAQSGETAKVKLVDVTVANNPAPEMTRHPFAARFAGPKASLLASGSYELKAPGFDPVTLHVSHSGFDGQGEKGSKNAIYTVAFV